MNNATTENLRTRGAAAAYERMLGDDAQEQACAMLGDEFDFALRREDVQAPMTAYTLGQSLRLSSVAIADVIADEVHDDATMAALFGLLRAAQRGEDVQARAHDLMTRFRQSYIDMYADAAADYMRG